MQLKSTRQQIANAARRLEETGLVVNTSGNVSVRLGDTIAITPSSCACASLTAADIVLIDAAGRVVDGDLLPSSETPLHLALYASDADINAIVHTHSVYATAVSTLVEELPAIHYQITTLGGPVPVTPYRTFGTDELAQVVSDAMRGRNAVIMQNHGATTTGATLDEAFNHSLTLEWLARVYLIASTNGTPSLLDADELKRVHKEILRLSATQRQKLNARNP